MKHILSVFSAAAVCSLFFCLPAAAEWQPDFSVDADEVLLLNLDTDTVVWQKDADEPHAIASLTKMMTGLLFLESGSYDPDTVLTVPDRLQSEFDRIKADDGSRMDLVVGEEMTMHDLLYSMMLPSANDCASVLADYLSGGNISAFVDQMNARAGELGCTDTHFSCPHGLYDADNYSTANDLAKLAKACIANDTFMEVVSTEEYWLSMNNVHTTVRTEGAPEGMYLKLKSTIQLQDPTSPVYRDYVHGLKTGFTDAAGRCICVYTERDGVHYLLVLLGVEDVKENGIRLYYRYADELLDWAYDSFSVRNADLAELETDPIPLKYSEDGDTVSVSASGSIDGIFCLSDEEIHYTIDLPEELVAPVEEGQVLGTASVFLGAEELGSFDLTAEKSFSYSNRLYWEEQLGAYFPALRGVFLAAAALFVLLLGLRLFVAARMKRNRRPRRENAAVYHRPTRKK